MNKKQEKALMAFTTATVNLLFALRPEGLNLGLIDLLLSSGRMDEAAGVMVNYMNRLKMGE